MKNNQSAQYQSRFAKPLHTLTTAELAEYNQWKLNIDLGIAKSEKLQDDAAVLLVIIVFPILLVLFCLLAY